MGGNSDYWKGRAVWKMPEWVEPVGIVAILLIAMFVSRRRDFSILGKETSSSSSYRPLIQQEESPRTSDESEFTYGPKPTPEYSPKRRRILGLWTILTPNSSRFARHIHSRILQKFPFLVEMFYWVITYLFYRMTAHFAAVYYGGQDSLWSVAEDHGIAILEAEAWATGATSTGTKRWVEWRVQQWFLAGVQASDYRQILLTILNRVYALIHIPGTVGFIAYYYAAAPSFTRFSIVRRTLSSVNGLAFLVFTFFPTSPPRFLPKEFGFVDTVNAEDAASVFMSGQYVNKLAAMPSMHFGYAFCIGCVFTYESGFLREWCRLRPRKASTERGSHRRSGAAGAAIDLEQASLIVRESDIGMEKEGGDEEAEASDRRRSPVSRIFCLLFGILYPSLILLCIVATANHYFLDAIVAALAVMVSFLCNRVLLNFLVLEDWLLWAWRLEKPEPTTGRRR